MHWSLSVHTPPCIHVRAFNLSVRTASLWWHGTRCGSATYRGDGADGLRRARGCRALPSGEAVSNNVARLALHRCHTTMLEQWQRIKGLAAQRRSTYHIALGGAACGRPATVNVTLHVRHSRQQSRQHSDGRVKGCSESPRHRSSAGRCTSGRHEACAACRLLTMQHSSLPTSLRCRPGAVVPRTNHSHSRWLRCTLHPASGTARITPTTALHTTALHTTAHHCTPLHTTPHHTTLHYTTPLHTTTAKPQQSATHHEARRAAVSSRSGLAATVDIRLHACNRSRKQADHPRSTTPHHSVLRRDEGGRRRARGAAHVCVHAM